MKYVLLSAAVAATLAGCATAPPVVLGASYDAADFEWAEAPGTNSIRGSAVLRTVGGEARSCAGNEATLMPDAPYSRARIEYLYGSSTQGFQPVPGLFTPVPEFAEDPVSYHMKAKSSACDAQGEFEFTGLPDGTYYVIVPIVWSVPTQYGTDPQGGRLMKRVELSGGETERVVLTR